MIKTEKNILEYFAFALSATFLLLGLGILLGIILPDNAMLQGNSRIIIGAILFLYGIARSIMVWKNSISGNSGISFYNLLSLILAVTFFIIGIGLISGLLFSTSEILKGISRPILGIIFLIYGVWHGARAIKNIFTSPKDGEDG